MIFGCCIKEALFFAESHMILTGFLEKEKTNIKNEFKFRANEKSVWNKVVWHILCMCTCITYITKVNSDISKVRYYLLFLFLVERKKYVTMEQKIMEKKTARACALQIKQK